MSTEMRGKPGGTARSGSAARAEVASRESVVESLNGLFAEEVEAALRYLHLSVTLKGLDRLVVRKTLLEGMQETIEHAQTIANKIVQLGGYPSLNIKVELPPEKTTGAEAIRTALAFEQAALDAYRELLDRLDEDNDITDFVRDQVSLESEHVAELSLLLE